jgi:hypothetical protein
MAEDFLNSGMTNNLNNWSSPRFNIMNENERPVSQVLEELVKNTHTDYITFFEVREALQEHGFGILMIFFSLCLIIPIPLPPGVAAIFGAPLLIFSLQLIRGMDAPWLPNWICKRSIKRKTLTILINKSVPYLKKVEKLLKPRMHFAASKKGERIIGVFSLIFSCSIMISLPFTHLVPAIGIFLMAFGLLSTDGMSIILGMVVGSFGIGLTAVVLLLGKEAVIGLVHFFVS